jgi:hypothetical protein
MKTQSFRRTTAFVRFFIPWITILLVYICFISCNKNRESPPISANELPKIAPILKGEQVTGALDCQYSSEAILYKANNLACLIQKLPAVETLSPGSLRNASMIRSAFGIIIMDLDNQNTWLYVNNDSESINQFERVKAYLKTKPTEALIFGLTSIRLSEAQE